MAARIGSLEIQLTHDDSVVQVGVDYKFITAEEAKELEAVRAMVTEIIKVDEFESDYLRMGSSGVREHVRDQAA